MAFNFQKNKNLMKKDPFFGPNFHFGKNGVLKLNFTLFATSPYFPPSRSFCNRKFVIKNAIF